ncbi:MAG: gltS [Acidobacteria bacterium]|nr:gltS [Acidobacteriota bacterium]
MESISAQGIRTLHIDLLNTLVIAALLLFLGSSLVARIGVLRRFSIPAPVVGGLVFALLAWGLRGQVSLGTDTTLRSPLQVAFFTTIGFGATLSLLRSGGRTLLLFWGIATGTGILQNIAGSVTAKAMGAPALLGVICGAVTLTGGPATGLAFTETFENLGVQGAGSLIIASATFGIFVASLIGNPVACALIRRFKLPLPDAGGRTGPSQSSRSTPGHSAGTLIHNLILLLLVMGTGSAIGMAVQRLGFILPAFIFPMILAAAMRLIDDRRGLFGFHAHAMDALGFLALNFFLVIALMDLKLWQLAGLAVPMLVILGVQIVVTVAYAAGTTFLLLGRDYEAAVSTSGHIGFGMGITPNAVANMQALVERFGAAPRSFLVVPVVGAFFIDLTNSFVITLFINLLR